MAAAWLAAKLAPRTVAPWTVGPRTVEHNTVGPKTVGPRTIGPWGAKAEEKYPYVFENITSNENCKKLYFLLLSLLLENFVKKIFTRIGPCERARTQLSEYVWHMGVRMIIGQVITAQSQDMAAKVSSSSKLWSVQKKRHGHNFQNWCSASNQRGTIWVSSTLIRFGA